MRRSTLVFAALLAATPVAPLAAAPLTPERALDAAIDVLKGDPYGTTDAEVRANILESRLGPRRDTVCKGGSAQVWSFRVRVVRPKTNPDQPIDGWLVLDAARGEIVCANLPFLD